MIITMRECRVALGYPAGSPVHLLKSDIGERRRKYGRVPQNGLNRPLAQPANVVSLVVIVTSRRPRFVEESLHFQVLPRLNQICKRRREIPQWLEDSFPLFLRSAVANEEELQMLNRLEKEPVEKHIAPSDLSLVYSGLGEKEQALSLLEEAYEQRDASLVWSKVAPEVDPLRS